MSKLKILQYEIAIINAINTINWNTTWIRKINKDTLRLLVERLQGCLE